MKLTPVELRALEFKKVMRGDDPKEVKFYINQAADALEQLLLENKELAEKLERYEKLESTIKEAALQSQETKKTQEDQAKKEAELIIEKAKLEAEKIKGGLADLQNKRDLFFTEFKARLTSYLSLIEKEPELTETHETPPVVEKEPETPETEETPSPVEKEQEVIKDEETPSPKPTEEDKPTTEPEKLTRPDTEQVRKDKEIESTVDEETAIDEIQVNE